MTDWSRIVQQHGPAVWDIVYRLLGREADAADCFQNVFLSAIRVARKEPVLHWAALLRRLATARALECLRRRYRRSDRMTVPLSSPTCDPRATDPTDALAESELMEGLRQALADLEDRQAHVFWRACVDGIGYREIAEELNITVNHVGVLLNRARSTLRKRLQAFAPDLQTVFQREIST